jgi:hypothetical protein
MLHPVKLHAEIGFWILPLGKSFSPVLKNQNPLKLVKSLVIHNFSMILFSIKIPSNHIFFL